MPTADGEEPSPDASFLMETDSTSSGFVEGARERVEEGRERERREAAEEEGAAGGRHRRRETEPDAGEQRARPPRPPRHQAPGRVPSSKAGGPGPRENTAFSDSQGSLRQLLMRLAFCQVCLNAFLKEAFLNSSRGYTKHGDWGSPGLGGSQLLP